jgi:hypothetical protein
MEDNYSTHQHQLILYCLLAMSTVSFTTLVTFFDKHTSFPAHPRCTFPPSTRLKISKYEHTSKLVMHCWNLIIQEDHGSTILLSIILGEW